MIDGYCNYPDPNCQIMSPNGCNLCIIGYMLAESYCYILCAQHESTGECIACHSDFELRGDVCISSNSTNPCLKFLSNGLCY